MMKFQTVAKLTVLVLGVMVVTTAVEAKKGPKPSGKVAIQSTSTPPVSA
jgi:hypothetical protein